MNISQLTASAILICLLVVVATVYFTMYIPIRDQRLKRKKAYLKNKGVMVGLYYHLSTGVDLFLCKDWLPERIAEVVKALTQRSFKVRCLIDFNAFRTICGEEFDATRLLTKSIAEDTSIYPMYRYSTILWSDPQ